MRNTLLVIQILYLCYVKLISCNNESVKKPIFNVFLPTYSIQIYTQLPSSIYTYIVNIYIIIISMY